MSGDDKRKMMSYRGGSVWAVYDCNDCSDPYLPIKIKFSFLSKQVSQTVEGEMGNSLRCLF